MNIFSEIQQWCKEHHICRTLFVIDQRVYCAHPDLQDLDDVYLLPAGEEAKSLQEVEKIWEALQLRKFHREDLVIAIGGGATLDAVGFATSTYMRGIRYLSLPTTLLAMVDACLGGKTAINAFSTKNLIGSFHSPEKIFLSDHFLHTLEEREYRSGIAEIIKYGCLENRLEWIEERLEGLLAREESTIREVVDYCLSVKRCYVENDRKDRKGKRLFLNFGHTLAHAIEGEGVLHGEAVATGMHFAGHASNPAIAKEIRRICKEAGLPTGLPENCDKQALLSRIELDKKRVGEGVQMVLLEEFGKPYAKEIAIHDLQEMLHAF